MGSDMRFTYISIVQSVWLLLIGLNWCLCGVAYGDQIFKTIHLALVAIYAFVIGHYFERKDGGEQR